MQILQLNDKDERLWDCLQMYLIFLHSYRCFYSYFNLQLYHEFFCISVSCSLMLCIVLCYFVLIFVLEICSLSLLSLCAVCLQSYGGEQSAQ